MSNLIKSIFIFFVSILDFIADMFGLTHTEFNALVFFIWLPIVLFVLVFYIIKYKRKIKELKLLIERSNRNK